jgi:hypothetical protein
METVETSRSAVDTRLKCETQRFLGYDYGGHGLAAVGAALPLVGGIALHNILARVLEAAWITASGFRNGLLTEEGPVPFDVRVDKVIADGIAEYRTAVGASEGFLNQPADHTEFLMAEQACLLEALVRGWVRYRMPDILEHYDVVSIEQEHKAQLVEGFVLPLRLDVLLRAKAGGHLVVLDYKTMAYERDTWAASLRNSKQTYLYVPAVEAVYGEYCAGVQYEGLFKGARKKGSGEFADRKIQQSVLCYGYHYTPHGKKGPTGEAPYFETEYTGKKGQKKIAVWEHMPVKDWLDNHVPPAVLQNMFQTVPVTRPNPTAMREEVAVMARKERDWARKVAPLVLTSIEDPEELPEELGLTLEKNRDACLAYGSDNRCAFWDICNDRTVAADPLGSGLYKVREDHHAVEAAEEAA